MTQAVVLISVIAGLLFSGHTVLGYWPTYQIAYGALTLMAAMISLTFLWLWARRATPLALGMSLSWAGASSVLGWWWVYNLLGNPVLMEDGSVLFVFLSFYFTGAILHFAVIQRSFGLSGHLFPVPALAAVALSAVVRLLI